MLRSKEIKVDEHSVVDSFTFNSWRVMKGDFSCLSIGIFLYSKCLQWMIIRSQIMIQKPHWYNNLSVLVYPGSESEGKCRSTYNLFRSADFYFFTLFLFIIIFFFKEKQFAVDLWLLLKIFLPLPAPNKGRGLKINSSSTSKPGLFQSSSVF